MNKTYAVFGLGRYGMAVAEELAAHGLDVLAVDRNQDIVNMAAMSIPFCKCADVTEPEVIRQLDVGKIDVVIIAMAASFESSVMATMLCKEVGVKTIIVKCASEMHKKILLRTGADKVVFPENESGIRLAKNLMSSGFVDIIELTKGVSMVELDVKSEWIGKNLIELRLREKLGINVVAIKKGGQILTNIDPLEPFDADTKLIVIANNSKLGKLKTK